MPLKQSIRIGAVALSLVASSAIAGVIDNFTAGPILIEQPDNDAFFAEIQTGLDLQTSAAGFRQLSGFNGLSSAPAGIVVEVDTTGAGTLNVSTSANGNDSGDFTVWMTSWDQADHPLDLASDANAFAIDVIAADFGNQSEMTFGFVVRSGMIPQGGVSIPVTLAASATPYTVIVPFSAWTHNGDALDFTAVTRIALGNDNLEPLPSGTNLVIDNFRTTVPEPAASGVTLLLLTMGMQRRGRICR